MHVLVSLFSGLIVGAMSGVMSISFAAIVFSGPLEMFLDRAIGLSLLACALMSITGAFLFSYRGAVLHPQDITAILLASGAASIASQGSELGETALFATLVVLLMAAAMVAGGAQVILGRARLSFIVKFIPYPVLGGFLAATGYLLLFGAIGLALRRPVTASDIPSLINPEALALVGPWIAAAIGICVVSRNTRHSFVLPTCIAVTCAAFFAWVGLSGTGMSGAREAGLLLGPFGSGGFLQEVDPADLALADMGLVAEQALIILAVMAMAVLGSALNLSGIELATRRTLDLDRDTFATGVATLVAAPTGGLLGFAGLSNSILSYRLGLRGAIAGIMAAAVCSGIAVFGSSVLELLPRGLFAAVIGYLGIDLLYTWLWVERRRLLTRDYLVIVMTVLVAALFGFLFALALGFFASVILFVVSYAKQGIVRMRSDMSLRRSMVERDLGALERLRSHGSDVAVIELNGYIFFGTANKLRLAVEDTLSRDTRTRALLVDFSRVQGIDPSAIRSLQQVDDDCRSKDVTLYLSGIDADERAKIDRFMEGAPLGAKIFSNLDEALQTLEDDILDNAAHDGPSLTGGFAQALIDENPDFDLRQRFPVETAPEGETIVHAGGTSDELLILLSGTANVYVVGRDGARICVAHLLPDALVGEIGFYSGALRTADVSATSDIRLLRISRAALDGMLDTDPAFVASFHNLAARYLSRRLDRTTKLLTAALK